MAIYLKWHMCPYHEPLVALISMCPNTSGRAEYIRYISDYRTIDSHSIIRHTSVIDLGIMCV